MPRDSLGTTRQYLGALLAAAAAVAAGPLVRPDLIRALAREHGGIVLTQIPAGGKLEKSPAGMLRAGYGEGARLVLLLPDGATRVLSEGFHSAADPDVSFDGKRILFAGQKSAAADWNVYEMDLSGSGVRQITRGLGDCRSPAYQASLFELNADRPWYQATFVSAAAGELTEYGGLPSTNLYSVRQDGSAVRRLSFNPSASFDPFQMPDGRMLFASWQRHNLERGPRGRIGLFGINVDGTDYAVFAADEGLRVKHMVCVTPQRLAVFVEAASAPWDGAGRLAAVSLRRNLHSHRAITGPADGLFHSPSPLPDGAVLVSRRPADGTGTHAVYRLDPATGRREVLFDDPGYHDIQAKLVVARPEPDGRSSVVEEKDPTGKFYCLSVYTADVRLAFGTPTRLRVVEGLPRRAGAQRDPRSPLLPTRLLGELNLEEDGSFNIQTPANLPIQLQVLDAEGMALRSSAWIWVKNRESRGCIGCHEDGELVPENRLARALTKPSVQLTLPPERRRAVDFLRDVLPILTAKCGARACHGGQTPPRLGGGARAEHLAQYVHPGKARTSPLVWRIFGRNTSRAWDRVPLAGKIAPMPPAGQAPLAAEEKRTIVEWIDLGAGWGPPRNGVRP
jgi:hypothetical protein